MESYFTAFSQTYLAHLFEFLAASGQVMSGPTPAQLWDQPFAMPEALSLIRDDLDGLPKAFMEAQSHLQVYMNAFPSTSAEMLSTLKVIP